MARSIRTGSNYRCENTSGGTWTGTSSFDPAPCAASGGNVLVFKSDRTGDNENERWAFGIEGNSIFKSTGIIPNGGAGNKSFITAEEIHIEGLKFYVSGTQNGTFTPDDGLQPKVIISVSGYAFVVDTGASNPRRVNFDLQTTASQRKLDL